MEKLLNEIRLNYTDQEINKLLQNNTNGALPFTCHFNQSEEMFIRLRDEFEVPQFPVHHDMKKKVPSPEYLNSLRNFLGQIIPKAPQVFKDLTYFFDPTEIMHPCFFQVYKLGESLFLYLLRIDLMFHTHQAEIVKPGTNDKTAVYRSRDLFLESEFIPLEKVDSNGGKLQSFSLKQTISQTWIGETGRGYFLQGIWMDNDLTKFFSKLFLPSGKRIYPYYPYTCKFRTLCLSLIQFNPEERRKLLPHLNKALEIIIPNIETIQNSLRNVPFSENLDTFVKIKRDIPQGMVSLWNNLKVTPYLNEKDMKEFRIEF